MISTPSVMRSRSEMQRPRVLNGGEIRELEAGGQADVGHRIKRTAVLAYRRQHGTGVFNRCTEDCKVCVLYNHVTEKKLMPRSGRTVP